MKKTLVIILILAAIGGLWYFYRNSGTGTGNESSAALAEASMNPTVTLKTNKGDIVIELFNDKTPTTAGNFLELAKVGFYNGTKFHRVIKGFMMQGGDPNTKNENIALYGRGGPGYTIIDEFAPGLSNVRGTISMANIGQPNSGGSQFFINVADNTGLDYDKEPLTSKHAVFGKVVAGMEVVDAIASVPTNPNDLPLESIVVMEVVVPVEVPPQTGA